MKILGNMTKFKGGEIQIPPLKLCGDPPTKKELKFAKTLTSFFGRDRKRKIRKRGGIKKSLWTK